MLRGKQLDEVMVMTVIQRSTFLIITHPKQKLKGGHRPKVWTENLT